MELSAGWSITLRVIYAILILGASAFVGGWLRGVSAYLLDRTSLDPLVRRLVVSIIKPLVILVGVGAALNVLALESVSTSIAAMLGGATLAIGLGLRSYMSDAAAGALLLTLRPFNAGDTVRLAGVQGTIKEVGVFLTRVDNADGNTFWIPNDKITAAVIENITSKGTRRVNEGFDVGRAADIPALREALLAWIAADERFLADPPPSVAVDLVNAHGLRVGVRAWTTNDDFAPAANALREATVEILARLSVPEPTDIIGR